MNIELLTKDTVIEYLIEQKLIAAGESVEVEELTGGISNVVLAITTRKKKYVLKQALAELKVSELWEADQRRAIVEADALEVFNKLSPTHVPKLVFLDPIRFVLVLERVPVGSSVWKSDLLDGHIEPEIAAVLGRTLATWHNFGEINEEARSKFMEDSLFEQLRIDPFYRFVEAKNPQIRPQIKKLIDELEGDRTTIVHGDFSPKNIMVSPNGEVFILDFEVMHLGNPVFDLAFLLAHLLCKFFRTESQSDAQLLRRTAITFIDNYQKLRQISPSLAKHTSLIALARVEGKSPLSYLDPNHQRKLQDFTKSVLAKNENVSVESLFEEGAK
jgi:5-methylthioribose kinase